MRKQTNLPGFGAYMLRLSTELEREGRLGTSRTYVKTRSSFLAYLGEGDIPIKKIDARLIEDYNRHLRDNGLMRNTISFYNRVLRAVYNKAVREYGLCDCRPFRNVYTGVDRTGSRAVGENIVARLLSLNLDGDRGLSLARDLFIFSYSMRGMSFVDMAYLRKSQIRNGYLFPILWENRGATVISEALGHSSERMTRIYLGNLDASLVDEVNRKLMKRLLTSVGRTKKRLQRFLKAFSDGVRRWE